MQAEHFMGTARMFKPASDEGGAGARDRAVPLW
jgi:hypothetical protein